MDFPSSLHRRALRKRFGLLRGTTSEYAVIRSKCSGNAAKRRERLSIAQHCRGKYTQLTCCLGRLESPFMSGDQGRTCQGSPRKRWAAGINS